MLALALLVFVVGLLAGSPEAHAQLHADSDQPGHHCWLSHYLDQPSLLSPGECPQAPAPAVIPDVAAAPDFRMAPAGAVSFCFSPRGPPAQPSDLS